MTISAPVVALLEALRHNKADVALEGDDLLVRGDLTPELAAAIRAHKREIVDFLSSLRLGEPRGRASITVDPACRHEPFALNENQQAYWLGRDAVFESGEVAIHVFVELASDTLDLSRIETAWRKVVAHHDMLRAVVLSDGRQQVLENPPHWSLPVRDLRAEPQEKAEALIGEVREEMAHYCADLARWPSWKLEAFRLPNGDNHLLLSLDCWSIDGRSVQIIAADLAALYEDAETRLPHTDLSFRDYLIGLEAEQETPAYQRALAYWKERIKVLPPAPSLPRRQGAAADARFVRHERTLPASVYTNLKREASSRGLTVASVLIAVYAEVLGRWSDDRRFTLNIPRWNRHPLHEDVDQIVGEFATFELLAVELRAGEGFGDFATRLQAQFAEDLNHDIVSGVRVLRDWRKHHGTDPGISMPYVFTHEPDLFGEGRSRAYMASFKAIAPVRTALTQTPQVWIDAQYHDVEGKLYLVWDALDGQFPEGMVDAMFAAYAALVEALGADDPDHRWQSTEPCIALPADQQAMRVTFNDTTRALGVPLFRDALATHAAGTPDALALADAHGEISYAGLKRRVDGLAARLQAAGVGHCTAVALAMEKGAEQIVSALALHALGAVCVPLDPEVPAERLSYMARHCNAALLLTTPALADSVQEKLGDTLLPVLFVGRDEAGDPRPAPASPALSADDLHCILYTSGSTGLPKGVMVPLGGVLNVIADGLERFGVDNNSRFLSLTPFHHDLSLFDMLAAVTAGAAVILPDPRQRRDPAHWLGLIEAHGISHWNSVPAMMTMLLDFRDGNPDAGSLENLRTVILGGDWLPLDTRERLARWAKRARLHSIGGPTETTIWNITYPTETMPEGWTSVPYGRPTANNRTHVLNDRLEDCPDWVAGEMYCAGAGVTAGYLGDEERTGAAFITHPVTGERLYRTGDRGRFHPDGLIEMLGRADNQINLNGYRLELGEIETALSRHPCVVQSVAVPMREGNAVRGITAWAVMLPGQAASESELHAFACASLPRQMHPSSVRICGTLPLTANGKVDRKRLEADAGRGGTLPGDGFTPANRLEQEVAAAWEDVLGAPPASLDTTFFAAGGDSITAIRLYNRLLAGRVEGAGVLTIFRAPTVRALAAFIGNAAPSAARALPPVVPTPRDDVSYPATAAQARLWFDERVIGGGELYNLCFNLRIEGEVDPQAIERAFTQIIAQWEVLRIALREGEDGEPVQVLLAPWTLKLAQSHAEDEAALQRIGKTEAETPFMLSQGQPLRAHLVTVGDRVAHLIITAHHAAFDGGTFGHFAETLARAIEGQAVPRPEISTIDYARWEQLPEVRAVVEEQIDWWRKHLEDVPAATEITSGRPRSPIRDARGAIVTRDLAPALGRKIATLAKTAGTTPYVTLMTGLALVLSRLTGERRVLLGTHISLRDQPALEAMPGMMVNNIGLKLDLSGAQDFRAALEIGRKAFMEGWEQGLAPFNHVVRAVEGWADKTRHPLYSITFTHENTGGEALRAGGMRFSFARPFVARSPLDIDLAMADRPDGGIDLKAVYNSDLLDGATLPALLEALETLVAAVCGNPEMGLAEIALSAPPPAVPEGLPAYPSDLLALFDAAVRATPHHPALLDGAGETVASFAALATRLDQAAGSFVEQGVKPGDTIALHLPRGADMIAAMLAAWRCGAHFVAVPAGQADDARLAAILDDAKPRLLVGMHDVAGLAVSRPADWGARSRPFGPRPNDELAALIYTSGSTGRPNGVEFTKAALLNRLRWQWRTQPFTPGERCIARTAVAFVDYLAEIFAPLLMGHPVAVLDDETIGDIEAFGHAVSSIRPRRLLAVPSLVALLLEDEAAAHERFLDVDQWTVSGEPLPLDTARRLLAVFPEARLFNLYGSSETGADVTVARIGPDADAITIGKPLPGLEVHVVDAAGQRLPAGLPGELYVAGAGLARGYRNRAELTAERFVAWHGRRVFRTGDRGIRLESGDLLLLGRSDRQVKIRGQRIELGEIQAALEALGGVTAAAVVLDETVVPSEIVAAFSGKAAVTEVREALKRRLPPAAVPSALAAVEALPRTPGGKIAYASVATMVRSHAASGRETMIPPRTDTERHLARLWAEVLGTEPAGRETMFFDMGGHSLAAARLTARIRRDFAIDFPIRRVIERNALHDMACAIDELAQAETEEFLF